MLLPLSCHPDTGSNLFSKPPLSQSWGWFHLFDCTQNNTESPVVSSEAAGFLTGHNWSACDVGWLACIFSNWDVCLAVETVFLLSPTSMQALAYSLSGC